MTASARSCPSCHDRMERQMLPGVYAGDVEIDICFACHGFWFDHLESLKLAPRAIALLFKAMHQHQDAARLPLAERLDCPQCRVTLVQGFDVVRSGRYITHRCPQQHGRFSSFASFMIEKGFVRQLTRAEIADIAAKVGVIHCSSCGAPVDVRREDACSHCRSALSLLDPQAVEKAVQRLGAAAPTDTLPPTAVADALVAMAREQSRLERERPALSGRGLGVGGAALSVDLMAVGLRLLSRLWDD
jgi:Zn-finger nucleic acid-binding protein